MLLLLQNRGRLTSKQLSEILEVTPRTILRDVDALTEAGLPIIVFQGSQGGIELGFGYRTHLTGLAADEAEALAVVLMAPPPQLHQLGMQDAAIRARNKLVEALPDAVREKVALAKKQFAVSMAPPEDSDLRIAAIAQAVRQKNIVVIQSRNRNKQEIHPIAIMFEHGQWRIVDAKTNSNIDLVDCGDINISARCFA